MLDHKMTREELERLGALLFGYGWKNRLADVLEINRKTVSRWIADGDVPSWAADRIRQMTTIAPPPGTTDADDRDDACQDAMEPELTRLMILAEGAGWHRAEIMTAIVALSVSDIRHHAGTDAAVQILREAIDALTDNSDPA
jgi:hypothetical protein